VSKILGVVAALSIAFYSIFASAGPSSQRDTLEGDEAIGNASIDWQNVATDLAFHHKVDGIAQGFYPTLGARWKKSGDSFLGVQIDVRTDMSVGLREITGQSALFAGKTESQAIQLSLGRPEPGRLRPVEWKIIGSTW
jgi:hypothetical protein